MFLRIPTYADFFDWWVRLHGRKTNLNDNPLGANYFSDFELQTYKIYAKLLIEKSKHNIIAKI